MLLIPLSTVAAQDLSIDALAARADQPQLRLCLELTATPTCADAAVRECLARSMPPGGPALCVLDLSLSSAGPLVEALRLAAGPAHPPNREAPPVWLRWLPRRLYVQPNTRRVALWLWSAFFVAQLLWAVWSLAHNASAHVAAAPRIPAALRPS